MTNMEAIEQHICTKCTAPAIKFIESYNQWFCLDCLLGWPSGTIAGWVKTA
jgi:hypothetical protein